MPDDRLAVAAAARVLDDEEILKVEASPREEGGEVVEVEREAHGALGARRLVHLPGKHAADDGARAEELLAKLLGRGLAVGFESLVAGERMNEAAYDLDVLFSDGADFQTHEGKQFLR